MTHATNRDQPHKHAENTARKEDPNPTMAPASRRTPPPTGALTDTDKAAIRAAVLALPPLTDDQVDGLCEVIINARTRRDAANRT